ncbi:HNH endonuclease [Herbidospora cretacea]|uniref:HNH endonuclease signature motif containing protein n=1 Tax=Herbidospora cretacea TaxID=28444 RepID=UPI0018CC107C|nr:HNH endonuclease [Herbidospora cretacea]
MRVQRSLTDDQALWALEAVEGGKTMKEVAEILKVSSSAISALCRGSSYTHLPRDPKHERIGPGRFRGRPKWPMTPERQYQREAIFWENVDRSAGPSACWLFKGQINSSGYGEFDGGKAIVGSNGAHRLAYIFANGLKKNLPRKIFVRHLCANPPCCNPAHLTLGTQRDNMKDRFELHKNRPGPHPVTSPTQEPLAGWTIAFGDPEELKRRALISEFWQQVDRSKGDQSCWIWIGAGRHEFGYGAVYWEGRHTQAARAAYLIVNEMSSDEIPKDFVIRHLCPGASNPSCCNPLHLSIGTQKQNMADRMAAGKYAYGDAHHSTKFSDAQVRELREKYWNTPPNLRPKLEELAAQCGVEDWGTVWRWLNGKSRIKAGGPIGELTDRPTVNSNHARGERHSLVTIPDTVIRELREKYWGMPAQERPTLSTLAAELKSDTSTVRKWLHGKGRISAGGPTGSIVSEYVALDDPAQRLF